MLSKKYLAIKKCLTCISRIKPLHKKLIVFAKMYLDIDKGFRFSYVPDENGETEFLDAVSHIYASTPAVFFDVGAHMGTYTDEVISRLESYQGHLFDLSADTLRYCIDNHGHNKNLTINHLGLTDTIGEVEYRFYPGTQVQNGISGVGPYVGHPFELRKAQCSTGDTYCKDQNIQRINLLKIDTEGYDLHVLRGFKDTLSEHKIDIIQFEYNIKSGETHSMLGDFYDFLSKRGYIVGVLRKEGVQFIKAFDFTQNDFGNGPNYIACLPEFEGRLASFKPTIS